MKFTLSTKPLADALNLGVIPGNISKYYRLSCLAQLTASKKELRINLQASSVKTEILLRGSGDSEETVTAFVDCLVLKQIVGTFDAATTEIEFTEGGLILHSGASKCTLPHLAESEDGELERPQMPAEGAVSTPIDRSGWKFIQSHQMYAVALSFVHPVYMNVWVGESGDVIVGDFDNSLFTFSKNNKLGKTCLLTDTIINLFTSLPEGAQIVPMDKSYRIDVKTDGFEYASEFMPLYEGENGTGSYESDAIFETVVKDEGSTIIVPTAPIAKFLDQSEILSTGDSKIEFTLKGKELHIKDENIDSKFGVEGTCPDFTITLNGDLFDPVISHMDSEKVKICPIMNEEESQGLVVWTDELTVVLGSIE